MLRVVKTRGTVSQWFVYLLIDGGLTSLSKRLALKRLVSFSLVDIIFLQETLGDGNKVVGVLESLFPCWSFVASNDRGHFGVLAIGFNQKSIKPISS